ncbi:MAG: hypothetical protein ACLP50_02815 [Solirubrobacteraceae bacterium]
MSARIRQLRRSLPSPPAPPEAEVSATDAARIAALETRIADLEQLVQGFQDSVHREAERQEKRVTELEARVDPAALAVALSKDARDRGL